MDKRLVACQEKMDKGLEVLRRELATIRAGKATPTLLDNVRVDYYGTPTPLKQVASVSAPEPRLLVVTPWDKGILQAIGKAIQASDLGLNPQDDGQMLKIPIPPLNEERRRDLVKLAHKLAEECRVAVRNARRDAIDQLKKAQKEGELPEDDSRRSVDEVQKLHDRTIASVEETLKKKEAEVMEV
jgi:ribosome recycling factor